MRQVGTAVEIRTSSVDELLNFGTELLEEHGLEVNGRAPQPHRLRYLGLEQHGCLLCLGAWDGSELVGYSVMLLGPELHNENAILAQGDALYVKPGYRRTGLGMRLLRESIAVVKQQGASEIVFHAAPGSPMEFVLRRINFKTRHILYGRRL